MRRQAHRGNPEVKIVSTREDFSDGINIADSDDYMGNKSVRYALNYDLDMLGDLQARKGWGKNVGLNYLFEQAKPSDKPDAEMFLNLPHIPRTSEDYANSLKVYFGSGMSGTVKIPIKLPDLKAGDHYFAQPFGAGFTPEMISLQYWIYEVETRGAVSTEKLISVSGATRTPSTPVTEWSVQTSADYSIIPAIITTLPVYPDTEGAISHYLHVEWSAYKSPINNKTIIIKFKRTTPRVSIENPGNWFTFNQSSGVKFMKVLVNDDNIFERLSSTSDPVKTLRDMRLSKPFGNIHLELLIMTSSRESTPVMYHLKFIVHSELNIISEHKVIPATNDMNILVFPFRFTSNDDELVNIDYVTHGSEIFFGGVNSCLLVYDIIKKTFRHVSYAGTDFFNTAYKPTGSQAIRTGFNVFGTKPLSWIKASPISSKSIQGVYITYDKDNGKVPSGVIPIGTPFYINILKTGGASKIDVVFSSGTGDRKQPISATMSVDPSSTDVLAVYMVSFLTQPPAEVEIELKFEGETSIKPHYEYYPMGQPNPNAKQVEGLSMDLMGVTQMWDRAVYYKDDTLWYSDVGRFDYVPHFNYVTLNISPSDRITNITYFRGSYILFTLEKIFKISGHFDPSSMELEMVSDVMGCVAPHSVKMLDGQLIFLSSHGLFALKSERFMANMENLERLDDNVYQFLQKHARAVATVYRDQYMLHLNNNASLERIGESRESVVVDGRLFEQPDIIRYYKDTKSFTFDQYVTENYPTFIMEEAGELYSYGDYAIWRRGDSDLDFGTPFKLYVETSADNMDYPNHEKKFKQMVLKLGKEAYQQQLALKVYADGRLVTDMEFLPDSEISDVDLENSRFYMKKIRLSSVKCKNISFSLETDTAIPTSLKAISYVYKLGKMR